MQFGYFIDLATIQLDENNSSWIQGMTKGKYDHPMYGKIEFTDANLAEYADNVNKNVRGVQLDIDYDHKLLTTEAAGWVSEAKSSPTGLMLKVDWTNEAADKIKAKKFKYFSPEFTTEWTHPKTGVTHKHVLFGGALTNRPFLKDISPINFSEIEGAFMDPKLIKKILGLSEDATDDEVATKLREVVDAATKKPEDDKKDDTKLTEADAEVTKLAETNPAIAKMLADQAEMKRMLGEQAAINRMNDVTIKLSTMQTDLKNVALSEENLGKIRRLALEVPVKYQDAILTTLTEVLKGVAFLGEVGKQNNALKTGDGERDNSKKFTDAIETYKKENKVSYSDAVLAVSKAEPMLCSAYYEEMGA